MEADQGPERRRAERFPLEARVLLRTSQGLTLPAAAVNISSSGMLLTLEQENLLTLGEEVTIEVDLSGRIDGPFSEWGLAKVVRLEERKCAVQLSAGYF